MPPGDKIDVAYLAHLVRIALTVSESEKIGSELGQVLSYIEKLREANVDQVEPTAHAVPLTNVTRPDLVCASLPPAEALRNAPSQTNDLFIVPRIVE
jgi:aspartyl-tRNA(Asn)/glutamyl-tRNA(Gln) amidotransferase subunit C